MEPRLQQVLPLSLNRLASLLATHLAQPNGLPVRRAASAPPYSCHAHAWLHWPKQSAARQFKGGLGHASSTHLLQLSGTSASHSFHFAPQPNGAFNADANKGHAFGILMALVGARRPAGSGAG